MAQREHQQSRRSGKLRSNPAIDLADFEAFASHPLVSPLKDRYRRAAMLAEYAIGRLIEDLDTLNARHIQEHGRVAFTAIQGRVKEQDSFLRKLHRLCQRLAETHGFSAATLDKAFPEMRDVAGVRISCPYYDEVLPAVNDLVRPALRVAGYGTDLQNEVGCQDRDYLESGDAMGYRSYHFFVRVPTAVDIYGRVEPCLCEIQARTELQHVWADKSHSLFYKPQAGWDYENDQVVALMKAVSDNLRAVDQYLVDIRTRVQGGRKP